MEEQSLQLLKQIITIWVNKLKKEETTLKTFCVIPIIVDNKLTTIKIRCISFADNGSIFNVCFFDNNQEQRLNGTFKHLDFNSKQTHKEIIDILLSSVLELQKKPLCNRTKEIFLFC